MKNKIKIKLKEDYTDREKEMFNLVLDLFNTNYDNSFKLMKTQAEYIVKHLYIIFFISLIIFVFLRLL